jgi:aromatic ring-opening dioxygenase catalytic subunit (LigB family)
MDYRTIDDMHERGTLVRLTDLWTPSLARYRDQTAVVIDIEVLGYPRTISRQENGSAINQKYDCIYTVALARDGQSSDWRRDNVSVIRVVSLDVESAAEADQPSSDFAAWCAKEFCGVEPGPAWTKAGPGGGSFIGGTVLPHTIPMYEARHRPADHRNKSLAAIDRVRQRLDELQPDVIVLASTHWMPRDGFFIDDGAEHADGCDASYQGIEPQLFSFPGDPELAALIGDLARQAGLPVRRIHRVAQEHAVWVPGHLLCGDRRTALVPCSIWWRGPREAHRRFGETIGAAVRQLGRRGFFVASGGLSHTFDFSKPPEYVVPAGERFDRLAQEWLEKGQHGRLLDMNDEDFEAWNPEGRAGHLYMMRGALGKDVGGKSLCYQGSNGTGYLTMLFENEEAKEMKAEG